MGATGREEVARPITKRVRVERLGTERPALDPGIQFLGKAEDHAGFISPWTLSGEFTIHHRSAAYRRWSIR